MIYKFSEYLTEKSSLTVLGVPLFVMQNIQKDFALSPTAEWVEYGIKRDIRNTLIENKNNLLLQVGKDEIKVFVSVYEKKLKLYYIDRYTKKTGEWGDNWVKLDREGSTLTAMLSEISMENKYYLLSNSNFSVVKSSVRKIEKDAKQFDEFNVKFRESLLNYLTVLLKNTYSAAGKRVEKVIINNLASLSDNLSPSEIKRILYQNVDDAKASKRLSAKAQDIPKYGLEQTEQQHNSLTIFDEYLLQFEDDYSSKYHKYYNIKSLVDEFSMQKIFTAFIYYLYTGMLMDLNSYKGVSVMDDLTEFEQLLDNDF